MVERSRRPSPLSDSWGMGPGPNRAAAARRSRPAQLKLASRRQHRPPCPPARRRRCPNGIATCQRGDRERHLDGESSKSEATIMGIDLTKRLSTAHRWGRDIE